MNSKQRYKQLIKENNEQSLFLSNSYQKIANIYIKKARGFGVKSLDTEVKIKKVLEELTNFDQKNISVNIAIPNMTNYIEDKIKLLSKAPTLKFKIQEIAAVTLLLMGIIAYFIINRACSKPITLNDVDKNTIQIELNANNCFYISWKANEYASNGYILKIYINDEFIKDYQVPKQIKDISDEYIGTQYFQTDVVYNENDIFTFEIIAKKTESFESSNPVQISYAKNKIFDKNEKK